MSGSVPDRSQCDDERVGSSTPWQGQPEPVRTERRKPRERQRPASPPGVLAPEHAEDLEAVFGDCQAHAPSVEKHQQGSMTPPRCVERRCGIGLTHTLYADEREMQQLLDEMTSA